MDKMYDCYVAGPFFTTEQIERQDRIVEALRKRFSRLFIPRIDAPLEDRDKKDDGVRIDLFMKDLEGMDKSINWLGDISDGDYGTIWEGCYAFEHGLNVFYLDIYHSNTLNLMLAMSSRRVLTCVADIETLDFSMPYRPYPGEVE